MTDMQENQRILFREAIKAFDSILNSHEITKAKEAWEKVVQSHDGQILLFKEARAGNLDAINYLFYKLQPQIMKAFWKYFLGSGGGVRRSRIEQGDQYDFIFLAYQGLLSPYYKNLPEEEAKELIRLNLLKSGKEPSEKEVEEEYVEIKSTYSPLSTFDPEVFTQDTDIINKFGYYMDTFLKTRSTLYNTEKQLGGIVASSYKDKSELKNVSYEAHFENAEQASTEDTTSSAEDMDLWERFINKASVLDVGKEPTPRQILKAFLVQGDKFDVAAVAEQFDVTNMTIRNRLGAVGKILEENELDRSTFDRLLTFLGGHVLAKAL